MIEKYSPPAGPHQRSTAKINLIIGDILKETKKYLVPTARLELARPIKPRDFKSLVSTIPPRGHPDTRSLLLILMVQSSLKFWI